MYNKSLTEPRHDKTNKMALRPANTDQPGHLPSLIRVLAVRMKKPWVLSYPLSAPRRLWSDRADAQADLSLRWAHTQFVDFVMSWLITDSSLYEFINHGKGIMGFSGVCLSFSRRKLYLHFLGIPLFCLNSRFKLIVYWLSFEHLNILQTVTWTAA